jgi:peptide deformylase
MNTSPLEKAADAFATELAQWRAERGLSKKQLASEMGFDPSYVSHVEGRRHRPTEDFAKRAEAVLDAGGAIWERFHEYDELRRSPRTTPPLPRDAPATEQWSPRGTGLVVEQELARLAYEEGVYRCSVRRWLYNAGPEPVTRYPARVSVDRYPADSIRSNRYYREHPLTWDELKLSAVHGEEPGELMKWHPIHDRDSFKEVWLLFENEQSRFPLYPGERTTIEYSYHLGNDKWGQWFQRSVRLPTRRLSVRLEFPVALQPDVWGVQTSLTAESVPLRTPPRTSTDGDRVSFEWSTDDPPLYTRYRLEWRFRVAPEADAAGPHLFRRASDWMATVGVVQRGDERLLRPARPLDLPAQEALARETESRLLTALDRVVDLHTFGKGVGLAAPQLGLFWAVAAIQPPDEETEPIVLINPRVVAASAESDEQYEGCLSFFDERGLVRRPLRLEVEHESLTGTRVITVFEHGMARLVGHEIDHLEGRLYVDRMAPGAVLVPVEEYHGTGNPWRY